MPASTAREYHTSQTHYIRRKVDYNSAASGTQLEIGTVPANAQVLRTVISVTAAFNAGTTNVLIVGTTGDDDALVAAAGVDETAVAVTSVAPATLAGVLSTSAATPIFAKYTQTGTAASAGSAIITVEYAPFDGQ